MLVLRKKLDQAIDREKEKGFDGAYAGFYSRNTAQEIGHTLPLGDSPNCTIDIWY
jgi:hypothetical protein